MYKGEINNLIETTLTFHHKGIDPITQNQGRMESLYRL